MYLRGNGNPHSRYPCLRFVYLGQLLANFFRVVREADLARLNPRVSVMRRFPSLRCVLLRQSTKIDLREGEKSGIFATGIQLL
jgi:hypothetical protein